MNYPMPFFIASPNTASSHTYTSRPIRDEANIGMFRSDIALSSASVSEQYPRQFERNSSSARSMNMSTDARERERRERERREHEQRERERERRLQEREQERAFSAAGSSDATSAGTMKGSGGRPKTSPSGKFGDGKEKSTSGGNVYGEFVEDKQKKKKRKKTKTKTKTKIDVSE